MLITEIIPVAAAVCFVLATVYMITKEGRYNKTVWMVPAALSAAFLFFSLYTVLQEGLTNVWPNHTQNFWGNQVWIDLLIAIGIAFAMLAPRAKAQGMNPWLWLVLIICTGCIAVLAMFARVIYLENQEA